MKITRKPTLLEILLTIAIILQLFYMREISSAIYNLSDEVSKLDSSISSIETSLNSIGNSIDSISDNMD